MNHTMFYLMSWVREKLVKKQINNETHSTGKGKKEESKNRAQFEAPQQTGQRDLLKSAASLQSIV